MLAFIGLGNIGDVYANTKHNAGFWAIDEFARRNNVIFQPGEGDFIFSYIKKNKTLLIKPTTGMNKSGNAVKAIINKWGLDSSEIIIVLDDVDLPLGSIRIRPKGGDGCHRGLENIIYQLKTDKFPRIRLGIATDEKMRPSEQYVLKPFSQDKRNEAREMIQRCSDIFQSYIVNGIDRTMNQCNSIKRRNIKDG
ncbi:MAG: aminoacyl-tRNA hydrolase [Candidatus Neomarinimicrobiota bacterium]